MTPRFTLEENGHDHFKFTVHDHTIDEPIAWCMDRYEAELVVTALNKEHPGIDEEETSEEISA